MKRTISLLLATLASDSPAASVEGNPEEQMRAKAAILPNDQALSDAVAYLASLEQ